MSFPLLSKPQLKPFFILLAFASLVTTVFLKKDNPTIIAQNSKRFPVIINRFLRNPDTITFYACNDLTNALPKYMGKHQLADTILMEHNGTYMYEGILLQEIYNNAKCYGNADFTGLDIVVDYETTVPMVYYNNGNPENKIIYAYFPVYIINNNSSERYFNFDTGCALGIQMKDSPFYEPIEYFEMPMNCFDMNYCVKLLTGEFVLLLFKKYQGDTTGPLRIRIKNSGNTLYSAPFNASYNKSQINFGANYEKVIKPNPNTLSNIYRYFLGRIPQKFLIPNSQYQVSPEILHH